MAEQKIPNWLAIAVATAVIGYIGHTYEKQSERSIEKSEKQTQALVELTTKIGEADKVAAAKSETVVTRMNEFHDGMVRFDQRQNRYDESIDKLKNVVMQMKAQTQNWGGNLSAPPPDRYTSEQENFEETAPAPPP